MNKLKNEFKFLIKILVLNFLFLFSISSQSLCITTNNIQASTEDLLGNYTRYPAQNNYHTGAISLSKNGTLVWQNSANVSWDLSLSSEFNKLFTGPTNPYLNLTNGNYITLIYEYGQYIGFKFLNDLYTKDGRGADSYDSVNNILNIRKVSVGLVDYCNVKVTIDKIISVGRSPPSNQYDIYNQNKNELLISSVAVGSKRYYNVVVTVKDVLGAEISPKFNSSSFHGYASAKLALPTSEYRYGFSLYTAINKIPNGMTEGLQYGWGTWLTPNNKGTTFTLCPPGTLMNRIAPERWTDVFQTIEGGPGQWVSSRFPSDTNKFRMNSTPNCYNDEVSTPGYGFHTSPSDIAGIAQISNSLLLPPDGINFDLESNNSGVFGYGYFALPLLNKFTDSNGFNVGDQSLTLFVNSKNFKGPVAFFTPDIYTLINKLDSRINGSGLDAKEFYTTSIALEINTVPSWTSSDSEGKIYRKIPSMNFPINIDSNTSLLFTDLKNYSKKAIWNQLENYQSRDSIPLKIDILGQQLTEVINTSFNTDMKDISEPINWTSSINLNSSVNTSGNTEISFKGMPPGSSLPEYFIKNGNTWTSIVSSEVPTSTLLHALSFTPLKKSNVISLPTDSNSKWSSKNWAAGPFKTKLSDGSTITYVWYKFINQPAISKLNIDLESKLKLQQLIEKFHRQYGTNGLTFAEPSRGNLVKIDSSLIVIPPLGMEAGYVPIAIGQE